MNSICARNRLARFQLNRTVRRQSHGVCSNGVELEVDDDGYLLEPNYGDEIVKVIAEAEGITLSDDHWKVVQYMRDQYREHGHTPNFRNMLKDIEEIMPGWTARHSTICFPPVPPSRVRKVAGLPKPFGKGGY